MNPQPTQPTQNQQTQESKEISLLTEQPDYFSLFIATTILIAAYIVFLDLIGSTNILQPLEWFGIYFFLFGCLAIGPLALIPVLLVALNFVFTNKLFRVNHRKRKIHLYISIGNLCLLILFFILTPHACLFGLLY